MSDHPNFYDVVRLLRAMHPKCRHYAFFAANFWNEDELAECEANGDVPGRPGEYKHCNCAVNIKSNWRIENAT
jgi:hypothetical protein